MKSSFARTCLFFLALAVLAPIPAAAQGVVVLAGGGREGDQGDVSSWSYKLYRKLVENGDRNGDGVVQVAILTTLLEVNDPTWYAYAQAPTTANPPGLGLTHAQALAQALLNDAWLVNYFQWLGSTAGQNVQAFNVEVTSLTDANDPARVGVVENADAIFIKGGDQGEYFDKWNASLLETHIRTVVQTRAGAIGGTSAGAMSQAQYCLCGGADLISADVLSNAKTPYLDDVSQPGSSGIHADFLGFVPGVYIETHYTQRARMARMIGVLARAVDDFGNHALLGIGLEQKTGVVIQNGIAEVIGVGEVAFVKETAQSVLRRDAGRPLYYTHLSLDRLTQGWKFDLAARTPITSALPVGVTAVTYPGTGASNSGALNIAGNIEADSNRFERVANYAPSDYNLMLGTGPIVIRDALGFSNSGSTSSRAAKQETLFRALFEMPQALGVLLFNGAVISRTAIAPDIIEFGGTLAAVIVDAKSCTYKGLSPNTSNYAITGGALRATAMTNLRVHILGETAAATRGARFNTREHLLIGGPSDGNPDRFFADGFEL